MTNATPSAHMTQAILENNRLVRIAKQSPAHVELFFAMQEHGWRRGPLPPQPAAEAK